MLHQSIQELYWYRLRLLNKHAKNQLHNILFLTIMQWYGILVILSILGIPGHAHQKL